MDILELADGSKAFVKTPTSDITRRMPVREIAAYEAIERPHLVGAGEDVQARAVGRDGAEGLPLPPGRRHVQR